MLKKIIASTAVLVISVSAWSQSNVVTRVTSQYSATNDCKVNSIAGGPNFTIWRIACPSEGAGSIIVQSTWSSGYCSMKSLDTNYSASYDCNDYTVRRIIPTSVASSSKSSSSSSSVCSVSNIKINVCTQNASHCNEAFGRACYAAGGQQVWDYTGWICQKTSC